MLIVISKLFTYACNGLWNVELFIWAGVCLIFVLISTTIGYRIATRLPAEKLSQVAWVVFTIMGFLLFIRTFFKGV